ncbi:hypothetical protein HPT25_01590 [Bacillus sp. BRMEA1]|uniref:hypothetical protein n=1 Tax=Neobacillus endophyticus TaxID=2738405 RepID=UPI001566822B|nr:hypothetical protein [Neobacillus endophyticus]NRD76201.1 hypothetical protein [Neobacillus endophyticus]
MTEKIVEKTVEGRTLKYKIRAKEDANKSVSITLDIYDIPSQSWIFGADSFKSRIINDKKLPKCVKIAIREILMEFNKYRLEMLYLNI